MYCPFCNALDTKVVDSRLVGEAGEQVRRRRECVECKERFTTYETAELNMPRIIKSDGRREAFSEQKLRAGMERALQKRPVKTDEVEAAISTIKRHLRAAGEREVNARKVGDWVMEQLRRLDQVAFVRFASVYHRFEDVRSFLEEIERLENELPPELRKQQMDLLPDSEK